MLAGIDHLVILVGGKALFDKERARREVAGVGRRRGVRDIFALQVGKLLVGAVLAHNHIDGDAFRAFFRAANGEGDGTGDIDREVGRAGRKSGNVQTPGTHRLNFRRV